MPYDLLDVLKRYKPFDDNEALMLAKFIDFLSSGENHFDRSRLDGHVTGSAWALDKSKEYALLTHHLKLDKWLQLGGHCDGNKDVLSVALTEVREESGLKSIRAVTNAVFDIDVHRIPASKNVPAHFHYDVRFLLEADKKETIKKQDLESKDVRWVKLQDIETLAPYESVMRMVRKTLTIL